MRKIATILGRWSHRYQMGIEIVYKNVMNSRSFVSGRACLRESRDVIVTASAPPSHAVSFQRHRAVSSLNAFCVIEGAALRKRFSECGNNICLAKNCDCNFRVAGASPRPRFAPYRTFTVCSASSFQLSLGASVGLERRRRGNKKYDASAGVTRALMALLT